MERSYTFENLKCWQLAYELKKCIKKEVIIKFPSSEKYELRSQLVRASRSATANIAEGWGRFHYLDSNKFYYNSRGSISEILDHIIEARDEEYISHEVYLKFRAMIIESLKVLNGFIFYLKREHIKTSRKG
ncbi:four helix bundle protein [Algoriphagus ratkowskyi]|uniref:Four helix bundle protein n=1 Tax=Algoriphagus ratkowskyi TaxID=57028 RepID=A0A2W7R1Y5_9BACT|nr:four helix bundle protein [Algoriphagus ratkowskyi]PZX49947.1 four helix bundle protein [Algoriphagus ratkowskyi]TXD75518.1 four helix bundle protein [Algoriphagus ratkowskyi]